MTEVYHQLPLFVFEKRCRGCKHVLPLTDFVPTDKNRSGYGARCGTCFAEDNRRRARKYIAKNREKCRLDSIAYRQANLERCRARDREFKRRDPEKHRARTKAWKNANKERVRAFVRQRSRKLRTKINAQMREWRKNNLEHWHLYCRVYTQHRRKLEIAAEGSFTAADIKRIYADQEGRCYYCSTPLNGSYQIDHKHPLSKGGSHYPSNLCCACTPCNRRKHAMTEAEYHAIIAEERVVM